jgi:hypothetical protein
MVSSSTTPSQQSFNDAQRFLSNCLTTPTLAQTYSQQVQNAQSQNNPQLLTQWLTSQGYTCTPDQITQAQEQMQNTQLSYWVGTYGTTSLKAPDGTYSYGPALVVVDILGTVMD